MIRLDEETHIYYKNGVKIPGVTEVLAKTGIAKYPDIQVLRDARYRGTVVHKAIELYQKGTLDEENLAKEPTFAAMKIPGYVDAAKRFIDERVAKIINFEMLVCHIIFLYGGKLDTLFITKDSRCVIGDWKTGLIPYWVELQTGAYLEAILSDKSLELESDELWHGAIQLNPDGTYAEPRISKDRSGFGLFRQALNILNYTESKGR